MVNHDIAPSDWVEYRRHVLAELKRGAEERADNKAAMKTSFEELRSMIDKVDKTTREYRQEIIDRLHNNIDHVSDEMQTVRTEWESKKTEIRMISAISGVVGSIITIASVLFFSWVKGNLL